MKKPTFPLSAPIIMENPELPEITAEVVSREVTKHHPGNPGKPAHHPTVETRRFVVEATRARIRQTEVAELLGITEVTLRKYYRQELNLGRTQVAHRASELIYRFLDKSPDELSAFEQQEQRALALKVMNSHGWAQQVDISHEVTLPQIVSKRGPDHPDDK